MFIDAMSGYAKATIAGIVLMVLAGTHWKAYTVGRDLEAARQVDVFREQIERLEKKTAEYRSREQALVQEKYNAEVRYEQIRKRTRAADAGMHDELGRLRDELTATNLPGSAADSSAGAGTDGTTIERELFGDCAARYAGLAEEAGRIRDQVIGLQEYVAGVCNNDRTAKLGRSEASK